VDDITDGARASSATERFGHMSTEYLGL